VIQGVIITDLHKIKDDRGQVMHMLRCDAKHFIGFGEIYFSTVNLGAVKAWKLHRKMTLNLAVPLGSVRLVLYDERPDSTTRGTVQEIITGEAAYKLITIPPLVWNGFQGLAPGVTLLANCATLPHDPAEVDRREVDDGRIPYIWPQEVSSE